MERQRLLGEIGRRLRHARELGGWTLSDVARRAGLSRRYLTEAEAGRANLSVLVAFDLARALGTTPAALLESAPTPHERERIALLGLRGAGKSTLGRRLALALEVPFVELDQRVEETAGMSLAELFSLHGEAGFHRFEGQALERVLAEGQRCVLATGGSIVAHSANFRRLRETCFTVWLRASPAEHFARVLAQGDRRPMQDRPAAMAELEALLAEREPLYAQCDQQVDTTARSLDDSLALLRSAFAPGGA